MHELERLYRTCKRRSKNVALNSPPDIFAVCALFAKLSGCYCVYGKTPDSLRAAVTQAEQAGRKWRALLDLDLDPPASKFPSLIFDLWKLIGSRVSAPIDSLKDDKQFVESCLTLIVASDVACVGLGIPSSDDNTSVFELLSEIRVNSGTLCRYIETDSLRVLPKQHTPRSGFNLRSLTHHLALCTASEVLPIWTQTPAPRAARNSYNVLVAPWPLATNSSDFMAASRQSKQSNKFGYFDYSPNKSSRTLAPSRWLASLFLNAKRIGQDIDLVVFPESALTESQWHSVAKVANTNNASVIAGVRKRGLNLQPGQNSLRFKVPYPWQEESVQHKHHRWQIEKDQITTYGLGGTLQRSKSWWENIEIKDRVLNFFAIGPDLVICPLICEDLARQDPVGEIVRAVGPNLVIALLMDGPQLDHRWSARYATVLADDPGSSVLTVSSLGMVQLSRPRGCKPSRVVASWKDSLGSFVPLELAIDQTAMILNLQFEISEEHSIDGRWDGGVASTPVLCGVHPLN